MSKNTDKAYNLQQQQQLIADAKSNDALAFVQLLGIYSGLISSMASKFILPEAEFDDLCQEGRLALYRAVMSYDGSVSQFSTYAGTCIKNSMISWAKKANREVLFVSGDEVGDDDACIGNVSGLADNAVAAEILSDVLEGNSAGLSGYEKKVISLKLQGYRVSDIARLLERDEKSVENTLFRARAKLKKHLRG